MTPNEFFVVRFLTPLLSLTLHSF